MSAIKANADKQMKPWCTMDHRGLLASLRGVPSRYRSCGMFLLFLVSLFGQGGAVLGFGIHTSRGSRDVASRKNPMKSRKTRKKTRVDIRWVGNSSHCSGKSTISPHFRTPPKQKKFHAEHVLGPGTRTTASSSFFEIARVSPTACILQQEINQTSSTAAQALLYNTRVG